MARDYDDYERGETLSLPLLVGIPGLALIGTLALLFFGGVIGGDSDSNLRPGQEDSDVVAEEGESEQQENQDEAGEGGDTAGPEDSDAGNAPADSDTDSPLGGEQD